MSEMDHADEQQLGRDTGITSSQSRKIFRRSARSHSDVRHGRFYDDPRDSVRLVTPDLTPLDAGQKSELSQSPQTATLQSNARAQGREAPASVSNTDEESTDTPRPRRALRKSRARTETSSELSSSPGSLIAKPNSRMGSKHAKGSSRFHHDDSGSAHASQPNPLLSVSAAEVRNGLPQKPQRTFSYESVSGSNQSLQLPLAMNLDVARILNLMKTTCGRMHGILFFRPIGTSVWESGYCAINVAPGSLVCQKQGETIAATTLLPDLRGCSVRTNSDVETQSAFISVVLALSGSGYQLRPPVPETFDSWLAALLCWQPLRPKGIHNKVIKTRPINSIEKRPITQRQLSDSSVPRSNAVVKIGRMFLWDGPLPPGSQRHISRRYEDFDALPATSPWQRMSCALHENGMFRLLTEGDKKVVVALCLPELARSAIQQLDKSVLDAQYCIVIYPQYAVPSDTARPVRPLVVGLESKVAFEAWFVLLRTMTAPELYAPDAYEPRSPDITDVKSQLNSSLTFRMERTLAVKVTEAKLHRPPTIDNVPSKPSQSINLYTDVVLDNNNRARTQAKVSSTNAFWAEEFVITDLASTLSIVSLVVKMANPSEQEWSTVDHDDNDRDFTDATQMSTLENIEIAPHDPDYGRVDVEIDELENKRAVEKWWPMYDKHGRPTGTIFASLSLTETIVLSESEYKELSALLHNFSNGLVSQIAQVLNQELKYVSELFLDIFQASDTVQEWIKMLVEDEVDGVNKESLPLRLRFNGRVHSNESVEQGPSREALVRDLSRSAVVEANLLFRGNSLVTKALDAHMRRLGKEYLETTLGGKLRQILRQNADCEVDPSKVRFNDHLNKNWATLNALTVDVWQLISASTAQCPPALRVIFKHIQSCAEDRYGSFIRTVKYTSVSGFLFLRFFCPAILNPRLFGLIEENPPDRARRTFTLIAKSLNALASMVKFGTKETWMEPMNKFLQSATPEFKTFVDDICSITMSDSTPLIDPQYLAPLHIRARMSPMSREGLLTLPYLLDAPRSLAALVEVWTKHAAKEWTESDTEEPMRSFNETCLRLHHKTQDCINRAETADQPDRKQEPQWQQLLNNQQRLGALSLTAFEDNFGGDHDITALPQRDSGRPQHIGSNGSDRHGSSSYVPFEARRLASAPPNLAFTASTNSSTLSFDVPEDGRKAVGSREGSAKGRIFDYLNPVRKRNKGNPNEHVSNNG